ncbi:EpsG family protein [Mesobacillus harenae]|uniref:EpsG family protein n=1 Tax=Mesobacillus harenae TaxID=2213203 RepID=UPI0015801950|nr:EpsG family protein [Mesobacillus harenae]
MGVYLFNLAMVVTWSSLAVTLSKKSINKPLNYLGYVKPNSVFSFFVFATLFLVSALRWRVGTDYWTYERIFTFAEHYTITDFLERSPEYLTTLINWGIAVNFNDPQVTFAFYAFLTCFLINKAFENYSDNYVLSVILYILTLNYGSSFNGVSQWAAAAILFIGYKFILEKNFLKYLIVVLIATAIHSSALIAILFYFFVARPFKSKLNLIILGFFILASLFFNQFLTGLFFVIEGTAYGNYSGWFSAQDKGAHFLRFVVAVTPVILGAIFYGKIKHSRVDIDILLNFSLLNAMLMLLATKDFIFARFTIFTDLYVIFLIPQLLKIFKRKDYLIVAYLILLCYFAFMYLLLPVDSNLLPYRTIFIR